MSESAEVAAARRNLLIISSVLFTIEATGATIKSLNAPAITIEIQRPEVIVWLLYIIMGYMMFRFWQIGRLTHQKHGATSNKYLNRTPFIEQIAQGAIDTTKDEGYFANNDNPKIVRGLFSRSLTINAHRDGRGATIGPIKLPYWRMALPEFIADLRAIPDHRDFVEYTFPLLFANAVLIVKLALLCLHELRG